MGNGIVHEEAVDIPNISERARTEVTQKPIINSDTQMKAYNFTARLIGTDTITWTDTTRVIEKIWLSLTAQLAAGNNVVYIGNDATDIKLTFYTDLYNKNVYVDMTNSYYPNFYFRMDTNLAAEAGVLIVYFKEV